jgi:hypothetical protein
VRRKAVAHPARRDEADEEIKAAEKGLMEGTSMR